MQSEPGTSAGVYRQHQHPETFNNRNTSSGPAFGGARSFAPPLLVRMFLSFAIFAFHIFQRSSADFCGYPPPRRGRCGRPGVSAYPVFSSPCPMPAPVPEAVSANAPGQRWIRDGSSRGTNSRWHRKDSGCCGAHPGLRNRLVNTYENIAHEGLSARRASARRAPGPPGDVFLCLRHLPEPPQGPGRPDLKRKLCRATSHMSPQPVFAANTLRQLPGNSKNKIANKQHRRNTGSCGAKARTPPESWLLLVSRGFQRIAMFHSDFGLRCRVPQMSQEGRGHPSVKICENLCRATCATL
jgi:hypothetical protein